MTVKQIATLTVPNVSVGGVVGDVEVTVFQDSNGGVFAVDSSYIEQDVGPVYNAFDGSMVSDDIL